MKSVIQGMRKLGRAELASIKGGVGDGSGPQCSIICDNCKALTVRCGPSMTCHKEANGIYCCPYLLTWGLPDCNFHPCPPGPSECA